MNTEFVVIRTAATVGDLWVPAASTSFQGEGQLPLALVAFCAFIRHRVDRPDRHQIFD